MSCLFKASNGIEFMDYSISPISGVAYFTIEDPNNSEISMCLGYWVYDGLKNVTIYRALYPEDGTYNIVPEEELFPLVAQAIDELYKEAFVQTANYVSKLVDKELQNRKIQKQAENN